MEAQQSLARPLLPCFGLVEQWTQNDAAAPGRLGKLDRNRDPDRACMQLLQLCGCAYLDQLPLCFLYTDKVRLRINGLSMSSWAKDSCTYTYGRVALQL